MATDLTYDAHEPLRSPPQRAIQEAATSELAGRAAALWSEAKGVPAPLHAVQNFVYAIELPAQPAILRLVHQSHRGGREIEAELDWVRDLSARQLPVALPLRSLGGKLVEQLDSAYGRFFATCFERLPGAELDPHNPELWNDRTFERLGALMARLHQASYDAAWTPATMGRRSWRDESVAQNFHLYVPVAERAMHDAFDRVLAELDALPRTRDGFGLIHADLNHANFLITPSGLNLFDFDDSCYCWFAYDLLVTIFHFPQASEAEMNERARTAFRSLLRGYETVRRFNRVWLKWLPLLLQWRDLLIYGFIHQQLVIAALPGGLRETLLALRARIEAGRPIAELTDAG